MAIFSTIRLLALAALAGLALTLTGCFMTPGKFTSELAITGPDSFTFTYEGEIFFLGLSRLAQMGADKEEFTPADCYDDETSETRECSKEELESQRAEWEADARERAEKARKQAEQMAALMGGIDPSDPKAADELVKLLQRQKGWERVVNKGDGVFDVSYRVTGTMGHDFMFPLVEGLPTANPFVQMFLRKGGKVRVNAPGFGTKDGDSARMGSLAGLAGLGGEKSGDDTSGKALKEIPVMEGTFTVRVAPGMRILANNTDEGPLTEAGGEALVWKIGPRTEQEAPTALIAAGR